MSSPDYFHNIRKYLFSYADHLEYTNSLGLGDYAIFSENLFKNILNLVFDWNLINANSEKKNQTGYDLISKSKNIYIQITSNKKFKSKYDRSIESFKNIGRDDDRFIVIFIIKKINSDILESKKLDGVVYEAYDLTNLLNIIFYECKDPGRLKIINDLLEEMILPIPYKSSSTHSTDALSIDRLPVQKIKDITSKIYINRIELISQLFGFAQKDNGLLIGGPGYGKSFILEELQRYCRDQNIPCFIIRINDLTEGDNEEIGKELKIDKEWLSVLSNLGSEDNYPILIFDAYDTAKDEKLKSNVLKLIKKSIEELRDWRIIVSVRTYDATKSRKLLELFPDGEITNQVSSRNFSIPELSEKEVEEVFSSTPGFEGILNKCNNELKRLFKIPYFLRLFYRILTENEDKINTFLAIESEEQLLNIFWVNIIEDSLDKDLLIRKLTLELTNSSSLSCDKYSIVNERNFIVFNELVSSGVLEEVAILNQKISFTHNILLDFAISKYLLNTNAEKQIEFVSKNEKIPFIFRQSFIYFYTKLYKEENKIFWTHYFRIIKENTPLFRLLHQTTLIYVLVNSYNSIEELDVLFNEKDFDKKGEIIKKLLEGIRFLTKGNVREKDIDLLLRISSNLHKVNLWETTVLIEKSIEQFSLTNNLSSISILSDASCNCFDFVWQSRKQAQNKIVFDNSGGIRSIENICKTLPFNIKKAKEIFSNILSLLTESDFPISYFTELADNILLIHSHDKEMAAHIYKSLYFHTELSDKKTSFGNGVVLTLQSNRRQDYGRVHYILEEKFKELLKVDFEFSMKLGIEIYNNVNSVENKKFYKKSKFRIGQQNLEIYSDYSRYDYDDVKGPTSYINKILDRIRENLSNADTFKEGVNQINKLMPWLKNAMLWRRLFQVLKMSPDKINTIAFRLLSKNEIYLFDELLYESGELIGATWTNFTNTQKVKIEKAIISLLSNAEYIENPRISKKRVSQVLNCIPIGQAVTKDTIEILSENIIAPNKPLVYEGNTLADVSYPSREEKAQMAGLDLNNEEDAATYKKIEEIESFNNRFGNVNKLPSKDDYTNIMSYLEKLFSDSTNWSEYKKKNAEQEIARFVGIFSRLGQQLSEEDYRLIKKIALQYIYDTDYYKAEYEHSDLNQIIKGYGPNARNASISTLVRIMYAFKEKDIEDVVLSLMFDNDSIVRHYALKGLKYFWNGRKNDYWNIIRRRGEDEFDGRCFYEILLAFLPIEILKEDQNNVEDVTFLFISKLNNYDNKIASEIWKVLVVIILRLIMYSNSSKARILISENIHTTEFCKSVIFEIMKFIDPHLEKNDYSNDPKKHEEFFNILVELITYKFEQIDKKQLEPDYNFEDLTTIDYMIQHLYFIVDQGKGENKGISVTENNMLAFYKKIKPLIAHIIEQSLNIESGYMVAHTGYYLMKMLNFVFEFDPEDILDFSNSVVFCASKSGFTYDYITLKEIMKLTDLVITDHKELLYKKDNFNNLISVLDHFSNSGWQESMEMTWRLKEAF